MRDTPVFKFASDQTPFAEQGRKVVELLRDKKTDDEEMQAVLTEIESLANEQGSDANTASTDAFVTAVCQVGCKSMSHVLATIDRTKGRLLAVGPAEVKRQIISSVTEFWVDQPGTAVDIIDKLLNYTIVTPMSVIEWALHDHLDKGKSLSLNWVYELVSNTMTKVTNRVRQIAMARIDAHLPADQKHIVDETLARERQSMRELFAAIDDAVSGIATGAEDGMIESYDDGNMEPALLQSWGKRWLNTWRRKSAVEEAVVGDSAVAASAELAAKNAEREAADAQRDAEEAEQEAQQKVKDDEAAAATAAADAARAETQANAGKVEQNGDGEMKDEAMDEADGV